MGEDTKVVHKLAMPFSVIASIDGKQGKRECACMPGQAFYYNACCPGCAEKMCPGALKQTALNAKAIKVSGAPSVDEMER